LPARSKPSLVCRLLGLFACALLHSGHARATPKGEGAKGLTLFPNQKALADDGASEPWLRGPTKKERPTARQRARAALESCLDPTRRYEEEEDMHSGKYLLSKPALGVVQEGRKANIGAGDIAGAVESGALAVSVILDIKRDRVAKKDGSRPYRPGVGLGLGRLGVKVRTEF
jgi:hypothetical protein